MSTSPRVLHQHCYAEHGNQPRRMLPDEAAKMHECLQRVRAVLREEAGDTPELVDAMVRIADMVAAGDVPAATLEGSVPGARIERRST